MSENPDAPEAEQDAPDSPVEPETPADEGKTENEFDPAKAQAKITKANREAQNLRQRLKELEPLAAKAKELEDANKSESERLTERLTSAEERAKTAETKLLRLQVGLDKGLTPKQASRLVGSTKEELEEDADDLLATFPAKDDKKPAGRVPARPKEKLRGGGDPDEPVDETDPKKLAAAIPRR